MIALIQRVKKSSVKINNQIYSQINHGLLIFLGIHKDDTKSEAEYLCNKIVKLRIFSDRSSNMNKSIVDNKGEILVVSQFTLYGDCKRGNRPSFINLAKSNDAKPIYNFFISKLKGFNINVGSGKFGETMDVELINSGPVTIIIESKNEKN